MQYSQGVNIGHFKWTHLTENVRKDNDLSDIDFDGRTLTQLGNIFCEYVSPYAM